MVHPTANKQAWDHGQRIREHALLPVKPGEEADFESAFTEAKAISEYARLWAARPVAVQ